MDEQASMQGGVPPRVARTQSIGARFPLLAAALPSIADRTVTPDAAPAAQATVPAQPAEAPVRTASIPPQARAAAPRPVVPAAIWPAAPAPPAASYPPNPLASAPAPQRDPADASLAAVFQALRVEKQQAPAAAASQDGLHDLFLALGR